MGILALDLGGTKLASAFFSDSGKLVSKRKNELGSRKGSEVGELINDEISSAINNYGAGEVSSIGISVPGIYFIKEGTVWAPNIRGWENFPLLQYTRKAAGNIPVMTECDRACYILGEVWQGNAKGCSDAVFISVGTGIGAGILINGEVLRGNHGISGASGWMALQRPYRKYYRECGCFEYYASGEGIRRTALSLLEKNRSYNGELRRCVSDKLTSHDVFRAFGNNDPIATEVIDNCIELWGMAAANFISLFNPEKIIFGGGVFGPAVSLLGRIRDEATKWAQPLSMKQVSLEPSALGGDAGVYGAACLSLKRNKINV